jgi:hypothetical protein
MLRQTGKVPADHLDGRVLRALSNRGLLETVGGWVSPTPATEPHVRRHVHNDRQLGRRRAASSARSARAEAILRVVEQLESAIPLNTKLMIGSLPAYADDVIAGLRKLVRDGVRSAEVAVAAHQNPESPVFAPSSTTLRAERRTSASPASSNRESGLRKSPPISCLDRRARSCSGRSSRPSSEEG